jgi:hypothetical protein
MTYLQRGFLILALVLMTTSCSLIEATIENPSIPLTQEEQALRIMTREFTYSFFSSIESSADLLEQQYPQNDRLNQSNILLWKIHAEEGMQAAAYQISPYASLIDSWVFTQQMHQFFEHGSGTTLFENQTVPLEVSLSEVNRIETLAKSILAPEEYESTQLFVQTFASNNPFADITFLRTPAYSEWIQYLGKNTVELTASVGTMPEALADVSQRLSLVSEQTPKLMGWKAELIARNSSIDAASINQAVKSVENSSEAFQRFLEENPEYLKELTAQVGSQLMPVVQQVDEIAKDSLEQMDKQLLELNQLVERERIELSQLLASERGEITLIIDEQRDKVAQELDVLIERAINKAISQLQTVVEDLIIYLIALIVVLLFSPVLLFYLGFRLGKNRSQPSQ